MSATSQTTPVPTEPVRQSPYRRVNRGRGNFELWSWVFMRGSGILLLVLVFGHLFVNLMLGEGIHAIDFAFVAGKWASPFWQVWDMLMLWLAMLHGFNGVRTIINDYTERENTRWVLKGLLVLATFFTVVLGTLVIFTFDPCIDPNSTLSVCTR
ncbi:succinate dehydrogenase hydrophobic membrane anchor subunit [Phycicoccus sp. M110.8]|uniref:succinate dehydrogenase hydrophobic membrane anchor subunit n=1 Tax=Phycicoccus sp. M110.8 TaxID=3075433 RepID=UPI0028FD9E86|nr:succinate dehydrogenase hydrophobic membrane anchor subunit [Phycicoccus sp. M110.8]MDU0312793.1 succinate dehydrogenase hydrophobic membrane anchor subunit [Phycicoccus sp. M110.8]HET8766318.1 succinate dehydrogenase hydrophobic membrane anchor subunit [Pedococcus sp.]